MFDPTADTALYNVSIVSPSNPSGKVFESRIISALVSWLNGRKIADRYTISIKDYTDTDEDLYRGTDLLTTIQQDSDGACRVVRWDITQRPLSDKNYTNVIKEVKPIILRDGRKGKHVGYAELGVRTANGRGPSRRFAQPVVVVSIQPDEGLDIVHDDKAQLTLVRAFVRSFPRMMAMLSSTKLGYAAMA